MNEATTVTHHPEISKAPALGVFERFLTLWVALCIVAGIVLGQTMPAVFRAIGAATVAEVNLPVAVLVWLMIIPMLLKIDLAALDPLVELLVPHHPAEGAGVLGGHRPRRHQLDDRGLDSLGPDLVALLVRVDAVRNQIFADFAVLRRKAFQVG